MNFKALIKGYDLPEVLCSMEVVRNTNNEVDLAFYQFC
jgi:hypothetical protein